MKFTKQSLAIACTILFSTGLTAVAAAAPSAAVQDLVDRNPGVRVYAEGVGSVSLYGRPIATGRTPIEAAESFRLSESSVFGVAPDELRPESDLVDRRHVQLLMYDPETGEYGLTLVYYTQFVGDIPVFRSDLKVLVHNQSDYPVVWVRSSLHDLGAFQVPSEHETRFDLAQQAVWALNPDMVTFTEPRTVVWAGVEDMIVEPRLAITFEAADDRTDATHEEWRFVCDASTGEILYRETLIQFTDVTGKVQAMATPGAKANICTPEVLFNYPWARVEIAGGETVYADGNGQYTIPNDGSTDVTVTSYVDGLYFYVTNWAGAEETLSTVVTPPGPANFIHNEANMDDLVLAQTNIYVAGNQCRDWLLYFCPDFPGVPTETGVPTIVNRTDGYCPCNAWSSSMDGSINFCQPGGGCPNTAWQSVLNHEYGHHCIDFTSSGQGEYGEGMSDCFSMLPVDDPNLGYGFSGDCNSGLRTADNDCQYLASGCSTCGSEIHDCGMLLSGIVWSIRNELIVTEPDDYLDILSTIVVNSILLHTGTSIDAQIAIDFLTLDDALPGGDGNINNGTPHYTEICAGFSAHGIDCPELTAFYFEYPDGRPESVIPLQETTVLVNAIPVVGTPVPGTGTVSYRTDAGAFTTVPMTELLANEYEAELPGVDCGDTIEYYFSAQVDGGGTVTDPADAPDSAFSALSAISLLEVASFDFEDGTGWTVTGSVSDGPWQRDVPITNCNRGNPTTDFDGSGSCYLTDNVYGGYDPCNNDVDGGTTTLNSPAFDLSTSVDPRVSYARWYSNNYGAAPYADTFVVEVSDDNGASWVNLETVGPAGPQVEGGWYTPSFRIADFVGLTSQVKFRFNASDLGSGSVVEAAIDAFEIVDVECQPPDVPFIVDQPDNQSACVDESATFTVEVIGAPPFTYQWMYEGGDIPGATEASYTIDNASVGDVGAYSCEVTNDYGVVVSEDAELSVLTPADCDDADYCTADSCGSGACINTDTTPAGQCCDPLTGDLTEMSDGNACTDDICNPDGTVDHVENYDPGTECCDPSTGTKTPNDDGSDCTSDTCDPVTGAVLHEVLVPTTTAGGARTISISPQACSDEVALLVTSPAYPCLSMYVDVDGTLTDSPVMQTPMAWGSVSLLSDQIIPSTTYSVQVEHGVAGLSEGASATTWAWGDVDDDDNDVVNIADILLIIAAYQGDYTSVTLEAADLHPCEPNRVIGVGDILMAIGVYQGETYTDTGCPIPCE